MDRGQRRIENRNRNIEMMKYKSEHPEMASKEIAKLFGVSSAWVQKCERYKFKGES